MKKANKTLNDSCFESELWSREERINDLELRLLSTSLKNYAGKFINKNVDEKSSYVEISGGKRRLILRKTSLCWLFGKEKQKCSSDR